MFAIALLRYRRPLDEVLTLIEPHRAYLRLLQSKGWLLASGPLVPRIGGMLLLQVPDEDSQTILDQIRDQDPFSVAGMAQYEMWPWVPTLGMEQLSKL